MGRPWLAAGVTLLVLLLLEFPYAPVTRLIDPKRIAHRFKREDDGSEPEGEPKAGDATPPSAR